MSQHEYALHLEALSDENLRLLQHIDYLEERLSRYENVPTVDETLAISYDERTESDHDTECVENGEWNVWPYSWATSAWQRTSERFHSFHGRMRETQKAKDKTQPRRYSAQNLSDAELTLM